MKEQEIAETMEAIRGRTARGWLFRFMFPDLSGSDALIRTAQHVADAMATEAAGFEQKLRATEVERTRLQEDLSAMANPESEFRADEKEQRTWLAATKAKVAQLDDSSQVEEVRRELDAAQRKVDAAGATLESEAKDMLVQIENARAAAAAITRQLVESRARHARLKQELETLRREDRNRRWRFLANGAFQSLWPVFIWNLVMMLPTRREELPTIQPFTWAILASFGVQLYTLREELRRIYALAELAAAVFVAQVAGQQWLADGGNKGALQAIAAAYLFVRAIDNLAVGQRAANAADKNWNAQMRAFLSR